MKAAIFDVDNTITTRDTFFIFFRYIIAKKPIRIFQIFHIFYGLIKTRIFGADRILVKKNVIKLLKNDTEESIRETCQVFVRQELKKFISEKAKIAIQNHKNDGYKIILISASPEIYINLIGEYLAVDYSLGTRCEFKNNEITIIGKHCYGAEKCQRLSEFLAEEKLELDYKNSYFYSDHHSDLPLLLEVGNPVAVNASTKLNDICKKYNWPNLNWR